MDLIIQNLSFLNKILALKAQKIERISTNFGQLACDGILPEDPGSDGQQDANQSDGRGFVREEELVEDDSKEFVHNAEDHESRRGEDGTGIHLEERDANGRNARYLRMHILRF